MANLVPFTTRKENKGPKAHTVLLGLPNAGKTTIMNRLIFGKFTSPKSTIGLNAKTLEFKKERFRGIDSGGHSAFRSLRIQCLKHASAVAYVIDASDPTLYQESFEEFKFIMNYIPPDCVLVFLLNKSDLLGDVTLNDVLETFDFYTLQNQINLKALGFFLMSAKTGRSFYDAFDWLIAAVKGEEFQKTAFHLYNIRIYERQTGQILGQTHFGAIRDQPDSFHTLLSSLDEFAASVNMQGVGIGDMALRLTDERANYLLVSVVREDLVCILTVDESDPVKEVCRIGENLLHWITKQEFEMKPTTEAQTILEDSLQQFVQTAFEENILL
ncbi:MAG: ADP-ribosylation factor-like protein [Candidatus Heimdallarchaeota archaeon]